MKGKIFTAGFEGSTQDWFTMYMGWYGVTTVIDVRNPVYERDYHFPCSSLKATLARRNIDYIRLDCAPLIHVRDDCDLGISSRSAFSVSAARPHTMPVSRVAQMATAGTVCLICFENDPCDCHRCALANDAAEIAGLDVQHLFPTQYTQYCRTVPHIAPEQISF